MSLGEITMSDPEEYAFGLVALMLAAILVIFVGIMATTTYREIQNQKTERHFVVRLPI